VIAWDEKKRRANLRKHRFDFVDAEEVFGGVTYTYEALQESVWVNSGV